MLKCVYYDDFKDKQYEKDTFGDFQIIKVRYVPGLRRSTQNNLIVKPNVHP